MAVRITTNAMFHTYRANLYASNAKQQKAMERVETGRVFSSYSEDPAAASKAFQLRRQLWRTSDQITAATHVTNKYESAYTALDAIVDGDAEHPGLDGIEDILRGVSDSSGNGRRSLGQDLVSKAESIVLLMNTQYAGEYVFAGADGLNPPFTWGNSGDLYYRGNNVSTGEGYADYTRLSTMENETTFVDIGLGMEVDSQRNVVPSTAFNSSLNGAAILGYGQDEDGYSNNLAVLMRQLGDIFLRSDPDSGAYYNEQDAQQAAMLADKIFSRIADVQEQHVKISADAQYLNINLTQLETTSDTLNTEINTLEQMDPADAIKEMSWAMYSYTAALRVGQDILSNSLIDYMN